MSTETFYAELPELLRLIDIADPGRFQPVPNDWWIVLTDVKDSTRAIESGQYKDINLLGACSIVSVLNIAGPIEIPFVFGGDGAALLIPPNLREATGQALLASRALAARTFGLDLRVGLIPVAALDSGTLNIAKLRVSAHYRQAVLRGGGLSRATEWLKQDTDGQYFPLGAEGSSPVADYSGLECRWRDIKSPDGEMLSLIIQVVADETRADSVLRDIIEQLAALHGETGQHPVTVSSLRLGFSQTHLGGETRIFAADRGSLGQALYLWKLRGLNALGALLMRFGVRTGDTDWGQYKNQLIATTDYQKFDDALRMVVPSSTAQRLVLERYLEEKFKAGDIVHGLHVADRALMTCLIFERMGRQVHFIDGADGGYALAAKAMKKRMESSGI